MTEDDGLVSEFETAYASTLNNNSDTFVKTYTERRYHQKKGYKTKEKTKEKKKERSLFRS